MQDVTDETLPGTVQVHPTETVPLPFKCQQCRCQPGCCCCREGFCGCKEYKVEIDESKVF